MNENEYLIEVMTKIESFNQWLDKYNNFDFSNWALILLAFLSFEALLITFLLPSKDFIKAIGFKKEKDIPLYMLMSFSVFLILLIAVVNIYTSHKREVEYLENANITLEEFKKYQPINFDKFPEWARNDLIATGKLDYVDVRRVLNEQNGAQKKHKEEIEQLKLEKQRKELMNSMSK
jgi:hypothetical protein